VPLWAIPGQRAPRSLSRETGGERPKAPPQSRREALAKRASYRLAGLAPDETQPLRQEQKARVRGRVDEGDSVAGPKIVCSIGRSILCSITGTSGRSIRAAAAYLGRRTVSREP
jgi:hypothetical protein